MSYSSPTRKGYFPSTASPLFTPPYDAMWDDISAADAQGAIWDAHSGSSFVTYSRSWAFTLGSFAGKNVLFRQYVTPALGSLASLIVAPPLTPCEQITGPIARMRVYATIGGSPTTNFACYSRSSARIFTAGGAYRWTFGQDNSGTQLLPTVIGSGAALTAASWGVPRVLAANALIPGTTDSVVLDLGFRVRANAAGSYVFHVDVIFGDSSAADLHTGSTTQDNSHFGYLYYVNASAPSASSGALLKPVPTRRAKRWQHPPVDDRASSIPNEFILNGEIL